MRFKFGFLLVICALLGMFRCGKSRQRLPLFSGCLCAAPASQYWLKPM